MESTVLLKQVNMCAKRNFNNIVSSSLFWEAEPLSKYLQPLQRQHVTLEP